jgi:hypothetical protein
VAMVLGLGLEFDDERVFFHTLLSFYLTNFSLLARPVLYGFDEKNVRLLLDRGRRVRLLILEKKVFPVLTFSVSFPFHKDDGKMQFLCL